MIASSKKLFYLFFLFTISNKNIFSVENLNGKKEKCHERLRDTLNLSFAVLSSIGRNFLEKEEKEQKSFLELRLNNDNILKIPNIYQYSECIQGIKLKKINGLDYYDYYNHKNNFQDLEKIVLTLNYFFNNLHEVRKDESNFFNFIRENEGITLSKYIESMKNIKDKNFIRKYISNQDKNNIKLGELLEYTENNLIALFKENFIKEKNSIENKIDNLNINKENLSNKEKKELKKLNKRLEKITDITEKIPFLLVVQEDVKKEFIGLKKKEEILQEEIEKLEISLKEIKLQEKAIEKETKYIDKNTLQNLINEEREKR